MSIFFSAIESFTSSMEETIARKVFLNQTYFLTYTPAKFTNQLNLRNSMQKQRIPRSFVWKNDRKDMKNNNS